MACLSEEKRKKKELWNIYSCRQFLHHGTFLFPGYILDLKQEAWT